MVCAAHFLLAAFLRPSVPATTTGCRWLIASPAGISVASEPLQAAWIFVARLCRRTSRASSVANKVLGKRMKIFVLPILYSSGL